MNLSCDTNSSADVCRIVDLRCKEVINLYDGSRLGYVCDVEVNTCTGQLVAIIVPGPSKFFGLCGAQEDYVIPWNNIQKIGDDIILVSFENIENYPSDQKRCCR